MRRARRSCSSTISTGRPWSKREGTLSINGHWDYCGDTPPPSLPPPLHPSTHVHSWTLLFVTDFRVRRAIVRTWSWSRGWSRRPSGRRCGPMWRRRRRPAGTSGKIKYFHQNIMLCNFQQFFAALVGSRKRGPECMTCSKLFDFWGFFTYGHKKSWKLCGAIFSLFPLKICFMLFVV